jgi:hypothetical protein
MGARSPDIPDSFSVLQHPLLTEHVPLRVVHDQPPDSGHPYSHDVSNEVGNSYNQKPGRASESLILLWVFRP